MAVNSGLCGDTWHRHGSDLANTIGDEGGEVLEVESEDMRNGFQIVHNPWLDIVESRQYRFPKSKKTRIRKKWSKRICNFRLVKYDKWVHDAERNILYVGTKTWENMKEMKPLDVFEQLCHII